jgi:hypothetical protein
MTIRTKNILREAINIYTAIPIEKKEELIETVKSNLSIHYNGLNTIGMGLEKDKVRAAEIFLRIFN